MSDNIIITSRYIAYEVILEFLIKRNRFQPILHKYLLKNKLLPRDKKFITDISYGIIRHYFFLFHLVNKQLKFKKKISNDCLTILLMGAYQLYFMKSVPDYASISTSVDMSKRFCKNKTKFINAILRKISLKDTSQLPIHITLSYPHWMYKKLRSEYSKDMCKQIMTYQIKKPNHWIRINGNLNKTIDKLNVNKIKFAQHKYLKNYLNIRTLNNKILLNLLQTGEIYVQSPSSGLVVLLINQNSNDSILDACAAPGGKLSSIFKAANNNNIYGYEINKSRYEQMILNFDKMNINTTNIINDDFLNCNKMKFDQILLDVPCSGTGTINKNPDIKLRRNINDYSFFNKIQKELLNKAKKQLKPNGFIIYSTCSINKCENWEIIDTFLNKYKSYKLVDLKNVIPREYLDNKGALNILPHIHNLDGMFAVKITRK